MAPPVTSDDTRTDNGLRASWGECTLFAVDIAAVLLIGLLVMVRMGMHIAIALGMASAPGIHV